jgi:tagatose 1,6-diphosphate aldolase
LNPEQWTDEFLKYDYIGAPWLVADWSVKNFDFPEELLGKSVVGNGGFSLRSKKLTSLCTNLFKEGFFERYHPEDVAIGVYYRELLEEKGIEFAPVDLANQFSFEQKTDEDDKWNGQFGFHGLKWTDISRWLEKNPEYIVDKKLGTIKLEKVNRDFVFLDPGKLIDNELELVLAEKIPANNEKEYVPVYKFDMASVNTGEKMGQIILRVGNNENIKYGGHIGYSVDEKFRGHHYSARSIKLLFQLAKKHGINPLWITCDPENIASRRTCELASGQLMEIVDIPENNDQYQRGERKKCRYRFDL